MSKYYRYVGVSRSPAGSVEVRWANDAHRGRTLERCGHTEVVLFDMGQAEHPEECMDQLLNLIEFTEHTLNAEQLQAVYSAAEHMGFRVAV